MTEADARAWYSSICREPYEWVIEYAGHCIGIIRLHGFDDARGVAHVALGIFRPEHRGLGLGSEALSVLLEYAFESLGLVEVRVRVLAFNERALRLYRRCGFDEVRRELTRVDGDSFEDVVLRLAADRFRAASTARWVRHSRPAG